VTLLANTSLPANAFLAISLHGSGVELGTVSAGTVCRYSEALRLGLQGTVEIIESAKLVATPGRRKRWIEQLTDLPLLGIEAGELRILLGEPKQSGLFADSDRESLAQAVDLLFHGLAGFAAESSRASAGTTFGIPAEASPKLLGIVSRLMPQRRGPVARVTVCRKVADSTGESTTCLTLDRASRDRIANKIDKQMTPMPDNPAGKQIRSLYGDQVLNLLSPADDR